LIKMDDGLIELLLIIRIDLLCLFGVAETCACKSQ
jgi:hypothetical protein